MLLTVMDTSALLPLFMTASLHADAQYAGQIASLFSFGMAVSMFLSGFVYDSLNSKGRAKFLLTLGLLCSVSYIFLAQVHSLHTAGVLLFCAGACFAPAKYLPSTTYVLDTIEPAHSGSVLALMDVPGYIASAIFFKLQPDLVATYSWAFIFNLLALIVLVSTLCIVVQQFSLHRQGEEVTRH